MDEQEIQSIKQRFGIIGNSPLLNNAIYRAIQVSKTDLPTLITGESGSGKESFSKIIHNLSARKHGQFIAINCGAIPEGTIDSELFGHEKGSFTGSTEARKGYFEVSDGGTIFLDEIGEMPLKTQTRLLRVLENGEFIKVGSSKVQKTNVRVICATNVDLQKAVENKKFREDLYFRISTIPIYVPALRERGEDIFLLFKKFAGDFSEKYRVAPIKLSEDAKETIRKFRFSGNIRQLKNLVEQMSLLEVANREITAVILKGYLPEEQTGSSLAIFGQDYNGEEMSFSEREILYKVLFDMRRDVNELKKLVLQLLQSGVIGSEVLQSHQDLFNNIVTEDLTGPVKNTSNAIVLSSTYKKNDVIQLNEIEEEKEHTQDIPHEETQDSLSLEEKEKELILKALQKNKNKRKYAARDLGISERTLYRKIKQYDIEEQK